MPNAVEAQEDIFFYTIGLGVIVGLVLGWVAIKGKQWWLLTWSVGLVLSGVLSMVLF